MGFRDRLRQANEAARDAGRRHDEDQAAKELARTGGALAEFKGIRLHVDRVERDGQSFPLAGVRATAERAQTMQLSGTAFYTSYVTVSGPGFEWPVKSTGSNFGAARAFAAAVNAATGQQEPAPAGGGSVAEEIRKLVELRAAGALTDDEFAAAKARVLG